MNTVRRIWFWTVLFFAGLLVAQAAAAPYRALYWDLNAELTIGRHAGLLAGSIARIKDYHASEVHIFLNDNFTAKQTCNDTFTNNPNLDRPYFPGASLATFTDALQKAGLQVVYILSPKVPSQAYIDSLGGADGPIAIAKTFRGVRLEFDMEGNWTDGARARLLKTTTNCSLLTIADADKALLALVKTHGVPLDLTVSTTKGHAAEHQALIDAADTISPQLYDVHWGFDPATTKSQLRYFSPANFPGKTIVPAFSVECSSYYQKHEHLSCTEDNFAAQLRLAADLNAKAPATYPGYVVWASNEALPCPPPYGVCSLFGDKFLRRPIDAAGVGSSR